MKQLFLAFSKNYTFRLAGLLFAILMSVICFPDSVQADYVEGRVRVMRAEGPTVEVTTNGARVEVKTGTELMQGTAIRTGASGEVDLMFDNGAVLEIKPSTEFLIE